MHVNSEEKKRECYNNRFKEREKGFYGKKILQGFLSLTREKLNKLIIK